MTPEQIQALTDEELLTHMTNAAVEQYDANRRMLYRQARETAKDLELMRYEVLQRMRHRPQPARWHSTVSPDSATSVTI